MLKAENISVFNFENAIRGMRNPMNSWDKSDSFYDIDGNYRIGEKDLELAIKLIKGGSEHAKFMRQIFVSMDITAPLYWWKEMDQYRINATTNSTSTMHRIHSRLLTHDDFSYDKHTPSRDNMLLHLNKLIKKYKESEYKDKEIWRELIQDLPSSFNQMRTWTGNYQNLRNIYFQRKGHKLSEWNELLNVIETLPYSILITHKS